MRNSMFTALAAFACQFLSAAACASNAPITDVLLFPGGATITRAVQVTPDMTQVVIGNLPAAFDMQTLRAEASEGIHVGEIASTEAAKTKAVNPAEAALEEQVTALRDKKAELEAEAKAAQMVVDYLARVGTYEGTGSDTRRPAAMDGKTLSGLAGAMTAEAGKALARMQRIEVQKRDIDKKISALERDLAQVRSGTRATRTLTVSLTAERSGTLTVSYQVANAGWKPAYRASLDSEASRLELERQAIISQHTGEDWNNVRLTLSTSQPRRETSGPDPQPWLLSYQSRPMQDMLGYSAPAAAPEAYLAEKKPRARAEVSLKPVYAPPTYEIQAAFATEFQVPARTSLPADGREISVSLAKQDIKVDQYLQAAPRLATGVYVTAESAMPEGDWPAGVMQLVRDGSYVGSNYWNPQAKEKLVLGFGRDDQMHIKATPLKTDTGSSGIFDKRAHRKIATQYSITNRHKRMVKLVVVEAAPVATSDEIKIHVAFDPKPTRDSWEDRRGVVAWELSLAPAETAKIKTDYEIEYPAEGLVPGLR